MRSKSIVIYSDIHIGSTRAVCSDDPPNGYRPNNLQKKLFSIWNETIDELTQKPDAVVINGEPFDGPNRRGGGRQQWTVAMQDQLEDAENLIKLIPRKGKLIFVQGSGYHVDDQGTSYEEILARKMNALKYETWYNQTFAEDFIQLKINNQLFNITHHIGFARWAAYRTTALAREMAALHFVKDKLGDIGVIVRSHVHYFVHVEFTHTHGFTTPAWKYPDKFLYRGGMGGVLPDVGCVEVIVEPNGKILVEKHIASLNGVKPKVYEI